MTWMHIVQMVASLIVLAEALNKLERSDLFNGQPGLRPRLAGARALLAPWRWRRPMVVLVFKVAGWACLSVGAAGSLLTPPTIPHVAVVAGFALLVIRSRLKEG